MLFYQFDYFLQDPAYLFRVWEGGMSFHGGLIGVILAMLITAKIQKRGFWQTADFVAPLIPFGLGMGRIGNFINDELWGRVTDVPWAVLFPSGGYLPRHPSQLYEAVLEGIVLFFILNWYIKNLDQSVQPLVYSYSVTVFSVLSLSFSVSLMPN